MEYKLKLLRVLPLNSFLPIDCALCILAVAAAILLTLFVFGNSRSIVRNLIVSLLAIIGNSLIAIILSCYLTVASFWLLEPETVMRSMTPLQFFVISFNAAISMAIAYILHRIETVLTK